jgi:2-deoxy-D-gluconate 3-dehydrogenase
MASPKSFDLNGKVAIVTGGNGGIGRGIALGLAEAGASVAILARNEDRNRDTLAQLEKTGVPAMALKLDVSQRKTLKPALEAVERKLGPIDILVNNAGFAVLKGVLDHSEDDWDSVMETNLTS